MANYHKGLYNQLEEQILISEKLKKENANLRAENRELKAKLDKFMNDLDAKIEAAVGKAVAPLKEEIAHKDIEIAKANAEISRLKAIINKDSSNSSKPPSQNGLKKIINSREKSTRKPGGQKGHVGHRLQLPENMDELIETGTAEVKVVDYTDGSNEFVSRWEIDIKVTTVFTEYRYPLGEKLPSEKLNEVTYGDNIKTMTVLLSNEGIIAEERLAAYFNSVTNGVIKVSTATLGNFRAQFARKLENELRVIETDLLNGSVMQVDESPMRSTQKKVYNEGEEEPVIETAENTTFQTIIRTHSNDRSTLYTVNPKKDILGVERDNILPRFRGTLIHDHDKKYYHYGTGHGTCGAHLLRELKGLYELQNCPWGEKMASFVGEMNAHKNRDVQAEKFSCDIDVLEGYDHRYDMLVSEGRAELERLKKGELGYKELNAMLNRLQKYKECYLNFIKDYEVPFTNNLSELDLRPCKTKQKVSGCFRSCSGIENYAKARSFISTVKKRGLNVYHSILDVIKGTPVLS